MTEKRRIDVHHHILPQHYVDSVGAEQIAVQGSSGRVPAWGIQESLENMDVAGIETAITSISSPGFAKMQPEPVNQLARWCNEFAANMVRDHSGRFGMFATLPMPSVDNCLREATYALDSLNADGVCLLSNYQGRHLGHEAFHPLYEELNRRATVVFVHPTSLPTPVQVDRLSASTLEFPFETTRTIASLIFSGVIRRYPQIRWIFSHAGGVIPYLSGRIDLLTTNNISLREHIPNGMEEELSKLYFDTALSANDSTMRSLNQLVPIEKILFGTDYPFGPISQMLQAAGSVNALSWNADEKRKVERENALSLFPRFI